MEFNIALDINKLFKDLKNLGALISRAIIQTNITEFSKELYKNLDLFRDFYRYGNLRGMSVNSK